MLLRAKCTVTWKELMNVNCNRKAENNCNFTYCTKMWLIYWLICSKCGRRFFPMGAPFNHTKGVLLKWRSQRSETLVSGYVKQRYLCEYLWFLVAVFSYWIGNSSHVWTDKNFFVSPYGIGQATGSVTYKLELLLLCGDSLTQFFIFVWG